MKNPSHKKLTLGFDLEILNIPLSSILPRYLVTTTRKQPHKYKTILKSIQESGVVEPLVVYPNDTDGNYILLDGHWRYFALQELKLKNVDCLISLSDESFTYNHHVNRISVIQAQQMILKAIERGVSKQTLAKALNVNIKSITSKRNLLIGICSDVVELLKDKGISETSLREIKKVNSTRQMEIAELMVGLNTFSVAYVQALISSTPENQLLKNTKRIRDEASVKIELEMRHLEKEFQQAEEKYGSNICDLTLAISYLKRLLQNAKILTYLNLKHHEVFLEFEDLVNQDSI